MPEGIPGPIVYTGNQGKKPPKPPPILTEEEQGTIERIDKLKTKDRPHEERLTVVSFTLPIKHAKIIDAYCDDISIARSNYLKMAVFEYMKKTGLYRLEIEDERELVFTPVSSYRRVVKTVKPNPEERELSPVSWATDQGDIIEHEHYLNELSHRFEQGEEDGIQVHDSGIILDPNRGQ